MLEEPLEEYLACLADARGGAISAARSELGVLTDAIAEALADVRARRAEMTREDEMAKEPSIITGPHPLGGWQNKVEGSRRAANIHHTKAEAERKGRDMARARKVEHIIQDRDGKIQDRN